MRQFAWIGTIAAGALAVAACGSLPARHHRSNRSALDHSVTPIVDDVPVASRDGDTLRFGEFRIDYLDHVPGDAGGNAFAPVTVTLTRIGPQQSKAHMDYAWVTEGWVTHSTVDASFAVLDANKSVIGSIQFAPVKVDCQPGRDSRDALPELAGLWDRIAYLRVEPQKWVQRVDRCDAPATHGGGRH